MGLDGDMAFSSMRGALLLFLAAAAHAACTGGSPTWTTTPDSASVQTCLTSASSGDTVNISAGSATWSSQVSVSGKALTIIGATTCTGSGDPNVGGGVISCTDNTNITLSVDAALSVTASATTFVSISGVTWTINVSSSNGVMVLQGTHLQMSGRFHHNHVTMSTAGSVSMTMYAGYWLADHNFFDDQVSAGAGGVPFDCGGDFATHGYQNWNDPTVFGSTDATYVEQNYYTTTHTNTEGLFDAFYGCKIVVRYNTISGNEIGGWHGTDSGQFRGGVFGEIYKNAVTVSSLQLMNTRSGTMLFWGNAITGASNSSVSLQYYRLSNQIASQISTWGAAGAGLNWTPEATTFGSSCINGDDCATVNTLNAGDWQGGHLYAHNDVIGPTTNNASAGNYQNQGESCTAGSRPTFPACPTSNPPATVSDGGCTWTAVCGNTVSSPVPGKAGFCPANPDTACSTDATCSALSPGDTCSRFFDANGGVYPFRDQQGRGHNQTLLPVYEWLNSGTGLPSPVMAADNSATVQNRDYYLYTGSFTGSTGVGSGTLASRPATCTAGPGGNTNGVAYWATDQGNWNVSGDGSGQGVLYVCNPTDTWTVYYTPFTYPHPLIGTTTSPQGGPTSGFVISGVVH